MVLRVVDVQCEENYVITSRGPLSLVAGSAAVFLLTRMGLGLGLATIVIFLVTLYGT